MRVRSAAAAAVSALALGMLAQAPVQAMTDIATFDQADAYSAVVAMVIVTPPSPEPNDVPAARQATMYCSGVLIDDLTVLTASHCNAVQDEQWFKDGHYTLGVTNVPDLNVPANAYWFEWYGTGRQSDVAPANVKSNPLYKGGYRDDVSIQVIDHPLGQVSSDAMPKIPPLGLLDQLQKDKTLKITPLTVLGYGSEQKTIPANTGPTFPDTNRRSYADLPTIALDKQWIHQDQNLGKNPDQAGACYGDSGGPSLLEHQGTTYVVGVTSTGDGPCFATNVASRVDNASAHALIASVDEDLLPDS